MVTTVALLHFFYIWNETRLSSLYLASSPNLQMVSFAIQRNQTYFFTPEMLMVGALVVMAVPVIVLFLSQRFFMRDMMARPLHWNDFGVGEKLRAVAAHLGYASIFSVAALLAMATRPN